MKRPSRQRLSLPNLLVLLIASVASLATLKADHRTGRTSQYDEWPRGENRQSFNVTIAPATDFVASLNYSGEIYLELSAIFMTEEQVQDVVWAVAGQNNDGVMISRTANFEEFAGDVSMDDDGQVMGDAVVRVGRLCASDAMTDDDCLPCLDGCSLTIQIDLCRLTEDDINSSEIRLVGDDGNRFEVRCEKDEDTAPCSMLDDWIVIEQESLPTTICPDQGM